MVKACRKTFPMLWLRNCSTSAFYGRLILDVDPTMAFDAVARLFKVDWSALDFLYWLSYEYRSEKLFCVSGSTPMVRKLADGTE